MAKVQHGARPERADRAQTVEQFGGKEGVYINMTKPIAAALCAMLLAVPLAAQDLTHPSGLTADDLHLLHELKGLEQAFIDAETKHGVRADFLAAVAALESGWGQYQFEENNIMGFGWRGFDSPAHCIDHVAGYLAEHYLDPEGMYYNGATVAGVCVKYNGCDAWTQSVESLMNEIA